MFERLIHSQSRVLGGIDAIPLSHHELFAQVDAIAGTLQQFHPGLHVGILADNSPSWIAVDLASASLVRRGVPSTLVPLPDFFTNEQLQHLLDEAQVMVLFTDNSERARSLGFECVDGPLQHCAKPLLGMVRPSPPALKWSLEKAQALSPVQKITFTSGTTGQPKGVCLTIDQQLQVAKALEEATRSSQVKRHLCLLPLAVLLENIAGVYAPLLAGADVVCPPLKEVGLHGASQFDAQACLAAIEHHRAESIILLPQMLYVLLQALQPGDARIQTLRFVAVGGGKVPKGLLALAAMHNLPVFEGYGLSECASVVCLNTPEAQRAGSVGKPLSGLSVRIAEDGEIWVKGRGFAGYLHELGGSKTIETEDADWQATGDLGSMDEDGFLYIQGRKKNLLITGFGRNVSPEWPEGLLLGSGQFIQAVVMGEGMSSLCAVLVPRPGFSPDRLDAVLEVVNSQLPDYARIQQAVLADEPFSHTNGLTTANGRVRREAIWAAYSTHFRHQGELV